MPEKCHICETGWETGDLQFVGIMPDGDEIWVHADDCAYALEKVIECFGDGGWMTLEEYDAAEQSVHWIGGESAPLPELSTHEVDSIGGADSTPPANQ